MAVPWFTPLLHFHLNKQFKNVFCILALFGLAAVLATFQTIGQLFPNHLVTLGGMKVVKTVLKHSRTSKLIGLYNKVCMTGFSMMLTACYLMCSMLHSNIHQLS